MIWITSDTHYQHSNICRGVTKWGDTRKVAGIDIFYPDKINTRDFQTIDEMNDAIVNSINKYVMEDDELYHLGDLSFGGIDYIWEFIKRLNCKNIHLVSGNHDEKIKKNYILPNVRRSKPYSQILEDGKPISGEYPDYVEAQSIFKEYLPELTKLVYNKQEFILSHYPLEDWENIDRGSIMLHGHSHHKIDSNDLNMYYKRKDIGWIDRPFSLDEIIEEMKDKKIKKHDS